MVVVKEYLCDIFRDEGGTVEVQDTVIGEKLPLFDGPVPHYLKDEGIACGLGAIWLVKFFVEGANGYVGERGIEGVFEGLGDLN